MKKFTERICCIVLATALLFSAIAGFQREAVVASAEDTTDLTYQVLEGNGWWNQPPKSFKYSMAAKNTVVTFFVTATTDVELAVELNQDSDYITATTNHDAWTAPEREETTIENIGNDSVPRFQEGQDYTITVTRKDYKEADKDKTDYEIAITNSTTGDTYETFSIKNSVLTGDVSVYLMAQVGTFEMRSDFVPKATHGTDRTKWYSLSDVNNTPPADYVIPEGLVRDAKDKAYEKYFPKDSIQTVKVEMDESNLNYMLQNAEGKPSVMTNSVTIGDAAPVGYAGIKTKGNYTLSSTNESDSDRFSFTLNFGKYIKKKQYGAKQNFYGCQKISFNNCFFDKTIMKEYNAMRLMDEMGLPTPQYSLAKLYINGQYYGVYFMVEAMDTAIIERYQNVSSKEVSDYLTKPSYTNMTYNFETELEQCLEGNADHEFTMEALGQAGLLWQDSDGNYCADGILRNYSGIWEGEDDTLQDVAEMIPKVLTWNRKLQLLSGGKDFDGKEVDVNSDKYLELLESVMDTDEAVRYFATHSFLVQMDDMFTWKQNYGLYVDTQGKSLLVPWDYDLAWGTANWFGEYNSAEESINWDKDKMYPDNFQNEYGAYTAMSKEDIYKHAPLFHVIWQNTKLLKKYHTYMEDCAKRVSLGGTTSDGEKVEPARFAKTIETYYPQVTEAAKTENLRENVYYVGGIKQPEGSKEGIPVLKDLIARRAVSVWLQTQGKKADVTGYGCDILKIGTNFSAEYTAAIDRGTERKPSVKGTLTVVDEDTGIFATVSYPEGNKETWIQAEELAPEQNEYKKISQKLKDPMLYKIKLANAGSLTSDYKLYIPVSPKKTNVKIYAYVADTGELQELKADIYDNVYCVAGSGFSYIAVAESELAETPVPSPDPKPTPSSDPTPTPEPLPSQQPSDVPESDGNTMAVGKTVTVGKLTYKVTKTAKNGKGEVSLVGTSRKKSDKKFTTLKIGNEIKAQGKSYKITTVGKNAFYGYKYLKSVVIGKNISGIKEKAFGKCSKLKKITIKTEKLTQKKVGKQVFKGIHTKAVINVPSKKLKAYKKLLRARGVGSKVKIKK